MCYQLLINVTACVGDDSKGFYVQPTVILTKDPKSITMVEEIFGPVLTVRTSDGIKDTFLPLANALGRYLCTKILIGKRHSSWSIRRPPTV